MDTTFTNIRGLSQYTGLPDAWLRAEAVAGRIPCLRVGRRLLFHPESVEQALLANAQGAPKRQATAS